MGRYVAAAGVALILLALALWSRGEPAASPAQGNGGAIVRVAQEPTGRVITVSHVLRGSVSRAALVYELEGEDHTAAVETDCRRGLARGTSVTDDGYATLIELTGTVPHGASRVRLVIESETGTDEVPIEP
jgi:hypothetical protein